MKPPARSLLAVLALAMAAASLPAAAQPAPPPPVIVVVDMTQIMRDAKAAKAVQGQVEAAMNAYSKVVSQRENDLKNLRDELERQRTALASDVFNVRSQDYQQRYAALDHDVQTKRQAMQANYSEAMTKIENVALQIIADVAKERKANLVIAKAALLYMSESIDVTADVTQRLDAKVPTMVVNLPTEESDTAPPPEGK
jgi:outer membrane protein